MEPIAENRFSITRALYSEGMLRISRDSYGKAARKYSLVFLAIWVVMSAFLLCTGGTPGQVAVYLLMLCLILIWLNILAPRNHVKKAWNSLFQRYGSAMSRRVRFYQDHLEVDGDCTKKSIPYQDILEIQESKNLYLLISAGKVAVMVAKEGFTHGNCDEVLALIQRA